MMDATTKEARKTVCASECKVLATWLQGRAKLIEEGLTDDENTLAILGRYVGRIKADVDKAGWVAEIKELDHVE
tara:strand:+ start:589 stop:810 length:222 start_codon:yes stop_codon:yes gene_type:complete